MGKRTIPDVPKREGTDPGLEAPTEPGPAPEVTDPGSAPNSDAQMRTDVDGAIVARQRATPTGVAPDDVDAVFDAYRGSMPAYRPRPGANVIDSTALDISERNALAFDAEIVPPAGHPTPPPEASIVVHQTPLTMPAPPPAEERRNTLRIVRAAEPRPDLGVLLDDEDDAERVFDARRSSPTEDTYIPRTQQEENRSERRWVIVAVILGAAALIVVLAAISTFTSSSASLPLASSTAAAPPPPIVATAPQASGTALASPAPVAPSAAAPPSTAKSRPAPAPRPVRPEPTIDPVHPPSGEVKRDPL
jgi:hypothetical protein